MGRRSLILAALAADMAGQLALLQGELLEAAGEAQPARIAT